MAKPPSKTSAAEPLDPRVLVLIDRMVNHAERYDVAAKHARMTPTTAKVFLRTDRVRKLYRDELYVLKEGERARNFNVLIGLRDNSASDRVKIEAIKVLESDAERASTTININGNNAVIAGYVFDLSGDAEGPRVMAHHETIDAIPLRTHDDVGSDDV